MIAIPISAKDRIIAGFRPRRSAIRPITSPPSGRVTKPTPKVARLNNKRLSLLPGNNAAPICAAKNE